MAAFYRSGIGPKPTQAAAARAATVSAASQPGRGEDADRPREVARKAHRPERQLEAAEAEDDDVGRPKQVRSAPDLPVEQAEGHGPDLGQDDEERFEADDEVGTARGVVVG